MYRNEFARALAVTALIVSFVCGASSDARTLQESRDWGSLGELYCPPEDDCPDSYANSIKFSGNGTRIVVGSPYATRDNGDSWTGFVQVLEHVDGSPVWNQLGSDINGTSGDDQFGKEVSISADGMRIATVAPRYDVAEEDDTDDEESIGRLRVFDFDIVEGGDVKDWVEVGALPDVDAAVMSADGTTFVVGRTEKSSFGSAGVFRLDGTLTFQQIGGWINADVKADSFGEAVAISADGTRIAVGATLYDNNGFKKGLGVDDDYFYDDYNLGNFFPSCFDKNDIDNTKANFGLVRVYDEVNGNWVQVGGDIVGDRACDKFGASIGMSFDGTRIVVGAPESDVPYLSDDTYEEPSKYKAAGSVRVLDFTNGAWTDVGQPITGQYRLAQIGTSVAMSADGGRIVVGSANGWLSQSLEYPVCIYELVDVNEEWETVGKCIQPDVNDNCKSVAMDATGSVVGVTCSNMVKLNPYGGGARIFFQMDNCVKKKNKSRLKKVDVLVDGTLTKAEELEEKLVTAKDEIETEYKELREACDDTNCEQEMDKKERKKIKKTKKKFGVKAENNVSKFDKGETKITNQFVRKVQKKCDS